MMKSICGEQRLRVIAILMHASYTTVAKKLNILYKLDH